ncbi:ATP-dependent (S)-NAD(P)H-hydrate dehydratase [Apostasia shenzhenica]|uniref:ATP-dependent (S)-NAD(P)H-hydrate dehydratase n=1 Tax=Apostasia shenzhenica TaxID=1088818 RepID=A0A2I0AL53_9ASPA|nr:ATP-dependent (S)-NAD(P)H-hydrate dehydratase [Apostasia shenzhenica]
MIFVTFPSCLENCMLASSSVYRRQLFLLSSLGGYCRQVHMEGGGGALEPKISTLGADTEGVMRKVIPKLDPSRYKGQAGKIAVIGGCREYTGAPYFAAISALKIVSVFLYMQGADLSHVFCTKDAAMVIKSYSPDLIVHPVLEESYSLRDGEQTSVSTKVLGEVMKWMERFDCIVIGPGLGRDPLILDCVSEIIKHARELQIPIIIDGDGLFLVTTNLDLVKGNNFAILTPNVNEYKRLIEKVLGCEVNDQDASRQLISLARRLGGVTILRKGKTDLITDGSAVYMVSIFGSPRRCGGQGDILSGSVAVFSAWARHYVSMNKAESSSHPLNPMVLGSISGSALVRKAASLAFENKKRSMLTTDIIECLGTRYTLFSLLRVIFAILLICFN